MKNPIRPILSVSTVYGNNITAPLLDPVALRRDISSLEGYEVRLQACELESGWTYQLGCELTWARVTHRRAVHNLRRYERSLDV